MAVYKCEGCGHTVEKSGYDDRNFHDNVVPAMRCDECGRSSKDMGTPPREVQTKYPDWMEV